MRKTRCSRRNPDRPPGKLAGVRFEARSRRRLDADLAVHSRPNTLKGSMWANWHSADCGGVERTSGLGKCERYEERRAVASSRDITSGPEGRSPSFFCARLAALSRCFSTRAISFCRFLKVVRDPTAMCAPIDSKRCVAAGEGAATAPPRESTSGCSAESRHCSCGTHRRPSALPSAGLR